MIPNDTTERRNATSSSTTVHNLLSRVRHWVSGDYPILKSSEELTAANQLRDMLQGLVHVVKSAESNPGFDKRAFQRYVRLPHTSELTTMDTALRIRKLLNSRIGLKRYVESLPAIPRQAAVHYKR